MPDTKALNLDQLQRAVGGDAAAIRTVMRLQPAGGPGDKVFPPTFATGDNKLKYVQEDRRIDGQTVPTVLLDSVASQANRMEEALLEGWDAKELDFPVIAVDFSDEPELGDLGRLTTLQAPHRIADALIRDSVLLDGTRFPDSEAGLAYAEATTRNAVAVYKYCPTALVFGVWNSTRLSPGPQNKFQRTLVSEIVGVGVEVGKKVGSRLDPAGIQRGVTILHDGADGGNWTVEGMGSGKAKPYARGKGDKEKGRPASINHGNVAPSIDPWAGGVTFDYAMQTTVLSMPALRRLRFPKDLHGNTVDAPARRDAQKAVRTALAALALAAVAYQREIGYDLRSRSLLVPEQGGMFDLEIIPSDGGDPIRVHLDVGGAADLLRAAANEAAEFGFSWEREPLSLRPAPKLSELIRRSRALAGPAAGNGAGDA